MQHKKRDILDRMHKIKTDGFNKKDKTKIALEYLIPRLLDDFKFTKDDITINEEVLHFFIVVIIA